MSSYLINKTDRPVLNPESEPSFVLVCGMMLITCSGNMACVGQVLQNQLLCKIQDETGLHAADHCTLTSNHAIETLGERNARIHIEPWSALGKIQEYTSLALDFHSVQYFTLFPFALWQPHQDLVTCPAPIRIPSY